MREPDRTSGSIGYWLLPAARGRGNATAAVRLIAGWARRDLGITRVTLTTEPENELSRRVAERSGFHQAAILQASANVGDRVIDEIVYELESDGE